jgi:hypothetical protein
LPLSVDDDVLRTARTALPRDARPALQAALEHIVRNSATAIQKAAQNVAEILNGRLYTWPELSVWNGKWKRRERVVAESIGPALVYALSLLLDPELDYGVLLRRCALESCGRFALGVPPKHRGQPPNYFCPGTDHRVQSARQKGREAVAAHRACMSVGTWRRLQARKAK